MRGLSHILRVACLAIPALVPTTAHSMGQTEIEAFVAQVQSCWALAPEDAGSGRQVKIRVELDPEGGVTETKILSADKSAAGRRLAAGAMRALQRCAPYSFPTESYQQWKTLEVELRP